MTTPTWSTLSIDTSLALRTTASRLADEFTGTFGTETVAKLEGLHPDGKPTVLFLCTQKTALR